MIKKVFTELTAQNQQLITEALRIRLNAYAPYSQYKVGAALYDSERNMYSGCNVESADYTLTAHAECVAVNAMVKAGGRKIDTIAVVVQSTVGYGMPCGLCRQKIREFAAHRDIHVIGVNLDSNGKVRDIYTATLEELLPGSFGPDFFKPL